MIDLTTYDNKTVLQLVRSNTAFVRAVATGKPWDKVLEDIGAKCSPEQLDYIKKWVDKKN